MKKFIRIVSCALFLLLTIFSIFSFAASPSSSGAATSDAQTVIGIQQKFEAALMANAGGNMSWDMAYLSPLVGFLLFLNIFITFTKQGIDKSFLEIVKSATWALIAMSIISTSFYKSVGLGIAFSVHDEDVCGARFDVLGGETLDRDLFNMAKYNIEKVGCQIYQSDPVAHYNQSIQDLTTTVAGLHNMPDICRTMAQGIDPAQPSAGGISGDILNCIRKYSATTAGETVNTNQCQPSSIPGVELGCQISNITLFFAQGALHLVMSAVLWILQQVVNLVQFGLLFVMLIGVLSSLLMLKLIAPFFVLESTRREVIAACKIPLTVAFYGFTHKLLLFFIAMLIDAINNAGLVILQSATATQLVFVEATLLGSMIVALFLQIALVMKVPKFASSFVNLSLKEVVNVGDQLIRGAIDMSKAGISIAGNIGAAVATGGVAGAAMAAGSALGGSLKMAGSAISGISEGGPMSSTMDSARRSIGGGLQRFGGALEMAGTSGRKSSGTTGSEDSSVVTGTDDFAPSRGESDGSDSLISKSNVSVNSKFTESESDLALKAERDRNRTAVRSRERAEDRLERVMAEQKLVRFRNNTIKAEDFTNIDKAALSRSEVEISNSEREILEIDPDVAMLRGEANSLSSSSQPPSPVAEQAPVAMPGSIDKGAPGSPGASGEPGVAGGFSNPRRQVAGTRGNSPKLTPPAAVPASFEEYSRQNMPNAAPNKGEQFVNNLRGALSTSEGRRSLAKAAVVGGAKAIGGFVSAALQAGFGGGELSTNAFTAGNNEFANVFDNKGNQRYNEYLQLKDEASKYVNQDAQFERPDFTSSITDDEIQNLAQDLELIISGNASEEIIELVAGRMEMGASSTSDPRFGALKQRYEFALASNSRLSEEKRLIETNSARFSSTLTTLLGKSSFTEADSNLLEEIMALQINAIAENVYISNVDKIQGLLRQLRFQKTSKV